MISVIIPAYNAEKFIEKSIRSVFEQTYKDYEIVVINDGSKDATEKIAKQIDGVKIYNKENGGLASALNMGVKMAQGDYVVFLDADDYLDEKFLETLYYKANSEKLDVVVGGQYKVDDRGKILQSIDYKPINGKCYRLRLNLHGKMYRKEYIIDNHLIFPEGKLYEDNSFNIQAYFLTSKIGFVDYNGYFQLVHEGTITSKKITIDLLPIQEWEKCIQRIEKKGCDDNELFQFTVMSFFAYFLFVRVRKSEFLKKHKSFNNSENAIVIAEEFSRISRQNFNLESNKYLNYIKYSKQIGLKQCIAVKLFMNACRDNKLTKLVELIYRV